MRQPSRRGGAAARGDPVPHRGDGLHPVLDHAIGYLDCRVENAYDGGDHTIFIGRVEAAGARDGEPLLYFRSAYHAIAE